jgi:hypothetical protein
LPTAFALISKARGSVSQSSTFVKAAQLTTTSGESSRSVRATALSSAMSRSDFGRANTSWPAAASR